jgi:hypothetical protein
VISKQGDPFWRFAAFRIRRSLGTGLTARRRIGAGVLARALMVPAAADAAGYETRGGDRRFVPGEALVR